MSNLTLAHDFADIINAKEIERFDDLLHPDYINHRADPGRAGYVAPGREGSKRVFYGLVDALPDLTVTVHDALSVDDAWSGAIPIPARSPTRCSATRRPASR
jgi:hypothetical protein